MNPPAPFYLPLSRRRLLQSLMLASGGLFARGALAEALLLTPRMTEGPFYPDKLPLDQDNDLVRISNDLTPALGTITNLSGRILQPSGEPVKGALIELWQADDHGNYLHSRGENSPPRDTHFQGYGKFETAADGGWKFRTIKPALYPGRTRHFHFGITLPGQKRGFTTQLFFAGEPANERDGVLRGLREEQQRAAVIREFALSPETKELSTTWDVVLGLTPSDGAEDTPDHHGPPPREGRPPRQGQPPPPPPV